ncbi:MAG: hypothetical protein H6Q18_307 [Bacteroidetes bacterium]|nr:hypothetical protein [Bacteroidota bacterium]
MKKTVVFLFFVLFTYPLFSQISKSDSTVRVTAYWILHEKHTYTVTEENNKIKNDIDTIDNEKYTYKIDVEILDTVANSYTIQWILHDFKLINASNAGMKDLYQLLENSRIVFSTTRKGQFKEILNWNELQQKYKTGIDLLRSKYASSPEMTALLNESENQYHANEKTESSIAKLINQFYAFHGGKYKLGKELSKPVKLPNRFGEKPFDGVLTVQLDDIDAANNYSIIRSWQTANAGQMTDFKKQQQRNSADDKNIEQRQDQSNIYPVEYETRIASQIHGATGWVIYSTQTTEISVDNTLEIEDTIIELQ